MGEIPNVFNCRQKVYTPLRGENANAEPQPAESDGVDVERFRDILKAGAPIFAVNAGGACAPLAAPLARAGAAMFIDCERTAIGISDVPCLVAAAHAAGGHAILRVESAAPAILTRYLDCGVDALVIPQVESDAACADVVQAVRDQALGDPRAAVIVQIESTGGVAAAQSIARAEGIDAVLLGPNDLAVSMGYPGQPGHPQVQAALHDVAGVLRAAQMPFGLPVTPASLPDWARQGARLFYIPMGALLTAALAPYKDAVNGH